MTTNTEIVVAVKGIIVCNGKILIVKRADDDVTAPGTWESVGGKLDFGEDLEVALIREAKEEAGINVSIDYLLYASTFFTTPTRQIVMLVYLCRTNETAIVLSEEHSDYLWATIDELKKKLPSKILNEFEEQSLFQLEELL